MNILIIVIVATILIAGIGALVYVLIHRSKHKKEVLGNSQDGAIPIIGGGAVGTGNEGQTPQQPMGSMFDNPAGQGGATGGTVMNDITQGGSTPQDNVVQDTPTVPTNDDTFQPTVNRDFPTTPTEPEVPAVPETPTDSLVSEPKPPVNTLDIGQGDASPAGNILDNAGTSGTVADMAQGAEDIVVDSSVDDSKVPVTGSDDMVVPESPVDSPQFTTPEPDSMEAVPSNVGDSYTVPLEQQSEDSAPTPSPTPEVPTTPSAPIDNNITPQSTPEAPVTPSEPVDTFTPETPVIQSPIPASDEAPAQGGTDDSHSGSAPEMHI